MKNIKQLLSVGLLISGINLPANEFRTWNDILGREFEAKMISATTTKVKLENAAGKQVDFFISDLSQQDQKYISSSSQGDKKESTETADKSPSPILKALSNKTVGKVNENADYYAIYFSAHWCPPCRKFTPVLSKFYNDTFTEDANFDVLFVSSDQSEKAMEEYQEWGEMKFPALKFNKKDNTPEITKYAGKGIPSLVIVDRAGNVVADSYVDGTYVGPTSVLQKLEKLAKK